MALIRWEPARELNALQQEMNRLFSTAFDSQASSGGGNGAAARRWIPAMDLVEDGEQYVLRADLPGVDEDAVNVELEDNVLTISGERKASTRSKTTGTAASSVRLEFLALADAPRRHRSGRHSRELQQGRA